MSEEGSVAGVRADGVEQSSEQALGRCVQRVRQSAGLTQQQLCHQAGISYSTLAKIERGAIKSPSIFTIQALARSLGTSLDVLLGQSPVPSAPIKGAKHQSQSGIRFVYFDINGCLVRFFHRAFARLAEDTGATPDMVETTFWHYNDAVCRGDMSLSEFNKVLAAKLEVSSLDWSTYYLNAIDAIKEMHELVTWAAERYEVGLLSNIMPGLIDVMRAQGQLPQVSYAQIIDSSVVHAIKPEEAIYRTAMQRARVPAEQILLVDDSRANLMAAEHLGWHVLWFDDYRPAESIARIRQALEPARI